MLHFSFTEILVILIVALIVFGPQKLPEIAQRFGQSFRKLRDTVQHWTLETGEIKNTSSEKERNVP
jgi:Tat protein translocase TatB subunit